MHGVCLAAQARLSARRPSGPAACPSAWKLGGLQDTALAAVLAGREALCSASTPAAVLGSSCAGPWPTGAAPASRRPEPGEVGAPIRAGTGSASEGEKAAGRASEPGRPALERAFPVPERPRGQAAAREGRSVLPRPGRPGPAHPAPRRGDRSDRQCTALPAQRSVWLRGSKGCRGDHVPVRAGGWRGVWGAAGRGAR